MVEIKAMLLKETYDKSILEDATKYFQIKENGVRAIVHIKGGKIVGIRNRRNSPILYQFPELKEISFPFDTAILDGEICVFNEDRSVYYGGIDKRRGDPDKKILEDFPATLVVFDALKIDDEILVMKPYKYRHEKIEKISPDQERVRVAMNWTDGKAIWNKVLRNNLEGVVVKDPNAPYELGKRSDKYIKLKNYKTADLTIDDIEPNDKGTKVFGKVGDIDVECQLAGVFDVDVGSVQKIKYLDIVGKRLIQPTKIRKEQITSKSVIS